MSAININSTVGEIVRTNPAQSHIFENLGIDYCCGGKKTLTQACQAKGLDAVTVAAMLSALDGAPERAMVSAGDMTLSELCDHIQSVHHAYLREELPRLDFMTRKVAAVHGEHEPRLLRVRRACEAFQSEMASHLDEEDQVVFPAIRKMESTKAAQPAGEPDLNSVLAKLESEHENAAAVLSLFHNLTDHYTPPEWACNTFRALYDGLAQLEKCTHEHVHLENNVLFPRALGQE